MRGMWSSDSDFIDQSKERADRGDVEVSWRGVRSVQLGTGSEGRTTRRPLNISIFAEVSSIAATVDEVLSLRS